MRLDSATRSLCVACLLVAACGRDPARNETRDAGDQAGDAGVPLQEVCDEMIVAEEGRNHIFLSAPAAASDGSGTGLVWSQGQSINFGDLDRVLFTRLATGERPSAEPLILSDHGDVSSASVAWTGSEYGVAWFQPEQFAGDPPDRLRLARVDHAGTALAETADIGVGDCRPSGRDRVVWADGEYALLWSCGSDGTFLARFPPDGTPQVDAVDVPLGDACGPSEQMAVAWNGEEWAMAWEAQDCDSGSEAIWLARLAAGGAAIGDAVRVTREPARPSGGPALEWVDRHYCMVWHDERDPYAGVYAALLDSEGEMTTEELRLVPGIGGTPSDLQLAWSGATWAAAWDHRIGIWNDPAEIHFVPFDPQAGVVGEPVLITDPDESGSLGDLMWDSDAFVVAWLEAPPDEPDVLPEVRVTRVCEAP